MAQLTTTDVSAVSASRFARRSACPPPAARGARRAVAGERRRLDLRPSAASGPRRDPLLQLDADTKLRLPAIATLLSVHRSRRRRGARHGVARAEQRPDKRLRGLEQAQGSRSSSLYFLGAGHRVRDASSLPDTTPGFDVSVRPSLPQSSMRSPG